MQIRMKTYLSGHNVEYKVGQELSMPDKAAQRLIDAGFADKVTEEAKAEVKDGLKSAEKADRKLKAETR